MRMRPALLLVLASCTPMALAQPAAQPSAQPASQPAAQPTAQPAAPAPSWPIIWERDEKGMKQLGGNLDAIALTKNTFVKPGDLEKMKPIIAEWLADVNQMVVDNLDLLERLDKEKLVDEMDLNDTARIRLISQIMAPLASIGSLTQRLEQRGVISREASVQNQQASTDYLQKWFEQFQSGAGGPMVAADANPMNELSRFLYYMSNRDIRVQHAAILRDAAGLLDQITPAAAVKPEQKSAFDAAAAKVKGAGDDLARVLAMKELLGTISFEQQRAMLGKALELGAAGDVFKFPPAVPHPYAK